MVVTILFLVIAQSPMSAKRAAVMICYGILGAMIGRPVPASRLVALAILIVLIPNPYLIKQPGFQFSFGAVIALVTLCRKQRTGAVTRARLRAQVANLQGPLSRPGQPVLPRGHR